MNAISKDYTGLLELLMYLAGFLAIIYVLYKLFGLFKDLGGDLEKKLSEAKEDLQNMLNDLNPSDAPEKFKKTAKDIETIVEGTLTGKQNTPEYNKAMTDLHYGGAQWGPGTGVDTSKIKQGILRKHGQDIMPGETKVFHGGTYTETVVNNMVKCQYASGEVLTREDCLARKYGFSTYAQFNAWLEGVKAALKAEGKDPSQMSLDQIVKYGMELERKKEEWKKQNPDKATPVFDAYNSGPSWLKSYQLPLKKSEELIKKVYPKTPGGISIEYTPVIGGSSAARGLLPVENGEYFDIKTRRVLPMPKPIWNRDISIQPIWKRDIFVR
ncbi:hypothetical protein [Thermococcus sp.]|uniref:hypothetical protein n=1 Tax=Thermococcus sp. TaxID=35749 RepID=UPI0025FCD198|nr:hypothetical protein [Thermococcus sp.]